MARALGTRDGGGLTAAAEAALAALLRPRVEAVAGDQPGVVVVWSRPERSTERDDFRARTGLDRLSADRLPSGQPWRGQVESGRWFRRVRWGVTLLVAVSWRGLADGEGGAITVAEAVACFEQERARWQRRHAAKPFSAVVAGVFREPVGASPVEGLALLAWDGDAWRFHGRDEQPGLSDLFFPAAAEKRPAPARWTGMSTFCARLLSPFQGKHRKAESQLAARSREFQDAKFQADRLQAECERHAAADDWSPELLQLQRSNAAEAARRVRLLQRQVGALQQNVQLLTTAKMGGALIADAKLPIAAETFEQLDRSHYETQSRRQAVLRAEQALSATLLAEEPAPLELPPAEEAAREAGTRRLLEP